MKTVDLSNMKGNLRKGTIVLYGSTGIAYHNEALQVPGYGWVPCSRKLQNNFTSDPNQLMLVITESGDNYRPVTSDIWVTRSNMVAVF